MPSTTIGSRITSFIPLSSRSASRAVAGRAECRVRRPQQDRIGRGERRAEDGGGGRCEVEQQPGGERDERRGEQRRRAPGSAAASRRCGGPRRSPSPIASVNSTSTRPSVAITWSVGRVEGELDQVRARRDRATAPSSRKMATWGIPVRSTSAGEERGDQDDDPDQGKCRRERFGGHDAKYAATTKSLRGRSHCEGARAG